MELSFKEKRNLQSLIKTKMSELKAGKLSFSEKRLAQKEIADAFKQLKVAVAAMPEGTGEPEGVKIANDILAESRREKLKYQGIVEDALERLKTADLPIHEQLRLKDEIEDALEKLHAGIKSLPEDTSEQEGVKIANDILAGKYDAGDTDAEFDNAVSLLEKNGEIDKYEPLLSQVADYLAQKAIKKAKALGGRNNGLEEKA